MRALNKAGRPHTREPCVAGAQWVVSGQHQPLQQAGSGSLQLVQSFYTPSNFPVRNPGSWVAPTSSTVFSTTTSVATQNPSGLTGPFQPAFSSSGPGTSAGSDAVVGVSNTGDAHSSGSATRGPLVVPPHPDPGPAPRPPRSLQEAISQARTALRLYRESRAAALAAEASGSTPTSGSPSSSGSPSGTTPSGSAGSQQGSSADGGDGGGPLRLMVELPLPSNRNALRMTPRPPRGEGEEQGGLLGGLLGRSSTERDPTLVRLADESEFPGGVVQAFRAASVMAEALFEGYDSTFLGMLEDGADGLGAWSAGPNRSSSKNGSDGSNSATNCILGSSSDGSSSSGSSSNGGSSLSSSGGINTGSGGNGRSGSGGSERDMTLVGLVTSATVPSLFKLMDGGYGVKPTQRGHMLMLLNPSWNPSSVGQPWQGKLRRRAADLAPPGAWEGLYCCRVLRTSKGAYGLLLRGWPHRWTLYPLVTDDTSHVGDCLLASATRPSNKQVIELLNGSLPAMKQRAKELGIDRSTSWF